MRNLRIIVFVFVCLAAAYLIFIWPMQRLFRSFYNLERNAKRAVTGAQLQAWATGLLALAPTNTTPRVSELGTNFPRQLLALFHRPPDIQILEANTHSSGSIRLLWGGGVIGRCGFEIGSTNFVSYRSNARAWQPGVYFWTDHPPK